jgi:hypothetical protein
LAISPTAVGRCNRRAQESRAKAAIKDDLAPFASGLKHRLHHLGKLSQLAIRSEEASIEGIAAKVAGESQQRWQFKWC